MSFSKSALNATDYKGGNKSGQGEQDENDLARYIFRKYCGNNKFIPKENLKFILRDIYGFSHDHYQELDKESFVRDFFRIIDLDKDDKVGLEDIETLVKSITKENTATQISVKTKAIRQEKYNVMLEGMINSFNQFGIHNFRVAKNVFDAYDLDHTGYIETTDLPLILEDTCNQLGLISIIQYLNAGDKSRFLPEFKRITGIYDRSRKQNLLNTIPELQPLMM